MKTTSTARLPIGLLALALVLAAAVLAERLLERRDFSRVAAHDSFASVAGASVRYRLSGRDRPGPVVVFLNGMAGSLEQWDRVQVAVSGFAQTLGYDRGGSGFSSGSSAHDATTQADELAGLLEALRIDEPVVVIGFSTSASLARVFAQRQGAHLASLILVEPYLPEMEESLPGHQAPARAYARWLLHETAWTLFGLRRLVGLPDGERLQPGEKAVLLRFPHWWAVDRELLRNDVTARAALSADRLRDLPLTVVFAENARSPALERIYADFAARSRHGSLRLLNPAEHSDFLASAATVGPLVEIVHASVTRLAGPAGKVVLPARIQAASSPLPRE